MAHNDYVRLNGFWAGNPVLVPRDMKALDKAQYESLNGDDGGTWNPSAPIVIGGAGVTLSGSTAHVLSGGVLTKAGGRIILGHNDFPTFVSPRSRTILVPLVGLRLPAGQASGIEASMDPVGTRFTASGALVEWAIPQRYLHHGATLASADLTFRIGGQHLQIPSGRPSFLLARVDHGTSTVVAMGSTATMPAPATPAAYFANGDAQTLTFTCTTANVIDVGAYSIQLQLTDEGGAFSRPGNVYTSLALHFTSIADMAFE